MLQFPLGEAGLEPAANSFGNLQDESTECAKSCAVDPDGNRTVVQAALNRWALLSQTDRRRLTEMAASAVRASVEAAP